MPVRESVWFEEEVAKQHDVSLIFVLPSFCKHHLYVTFCSCDGETTWIVWQSFAAGICATILWLVGGATDTHGEGCYGHSRNPEFFTRMCSLAAPTTLSPKRASNKWLFLVDALPPVSLFQSWWRLLAAILASTSSASRKLPVRREAPQWFCSRSDDVTVGLVSHV